MSLFHRHTWSLVGTAAPQHHKWDYHTPFLYACSSCGAHKTKMVRGVWKFQDVATLSDSDLREMTKGG